MNIYLLHVPWLAKKPVANIVCLRKFISSENVSILSAVSKCKLISIWKIWFAFVLDISILLSFSRMVKLHLTVCVVVQMSKSCAWAQYSLTRSRYVRPIGSSGNGPMPLMNGLRSRLEHSHSMIRLFRSFAFQPLFGEWKSIHNS